MFEESDEEGEETQMKRTEHTQLSLSLPSSVLDVRARALEELESRQTAPVVVTPVKQSQLSRVVEQKLDCGPFFGLPSRVRELYVQEKGVSRLFGWQEVCLKSEAVKNKSNFLYSLPTSGGKTLVAEIIMLQELLCYKRNVMFILPYVSIVQEKIKSLTCFALELGFHLEEYAGPRGKYPPTKRLHKQVLYVCTIEKAHGLFNSLVSEGRESEVGLVVVDEVHMLGEGDRGANLESLITKLNYVSQVRKQYSSLIG